MTFSKDSPPNNPTPSLDEILRMQRQLEERAQRELQQESKSSASDNEESAPYSSSGPRLFIAASEQLHIRRQLQQESLRSAPENEEGDDLPPSGIRSVSMVAILNTAIAVLAESDEEVEDSAESRNHDEESNSQP
jgi:hypothetical protein